MVWFYVDDAMAFHPKAIQAGNAALGLWVRAGAWATSARTDGHIPRQIACRIGTRSQIESLITAGLWEVKNDGYLMHDWAHYQRSKTDIETKRETDRIRKRDQRRRQNVPPDKPRDKHHDSDRSPTTEVTAGLQADSSPPRLVPSLPPSSYFGGGSAVGSDPAREPPAGGPPKIQFCEKHPNGTDQPCRQCRQIRENNERHEAEQRRQRRAEIDNCPYCEDTGMRETPDGLKRCTHNPEIF